MKTGMKIEGCVALVTGANRGIGLGFVRRLLERGARRVYVASRNLRDAEVIAGEAAETLVAIELDVTDPVQLARATVNCPAPCSVPPCPSGSLWSILSYCVLSAFSSDQQIPPLRFAPVGMTHAGLKSKLRLEWV